MEDAAANKSGELSILVVHGRDFKPDADPLMDVITAALRAGVERDYPDCLTSFDNVSRSMAYYGDLTNKLLEAVGERYDTNLDIGDRGNALNSLRDIAERKRFNIRRYDRLPGKTPVPEFIADVAAPILGVFGLTLPLISCVSKDFCEYLGGKTDYASQVRERVRSKLCKLLDQGDRVMLITHGTGCAVAYDVLWQLSHDSEYADKYCDAKVDTWLTMGAPLGDSHIRKRLLGGRNGAGLIYPTNVITWYNVSAEDDYTCHDNTLADDYRKMMEQRVVSALHDFRIYNFAVRYGKSNPHSSVGYFIHPRVSKIVVDWIQATQIDSTPKYIL